MSAHSRGHFGNLVEWKQRAIYRACEAGEMTDREIAQEWHVSRELVSEARRLTLTPRPQLCYTR